MHYFSVIIIHEYDTPSNEQKHPPKSISNNFDNAQNCRRCLPIFFAFQVVHYVVFLMKNKYPPRTRKYGNKNTSRGKWLGRKYRYAKRNWRRRLGNVCSKYFPLTFLLPLHWSLLILLKAETETKLSKIWFVKSLVSCCPEAYLLIIYFPSRFIKKYCKGAQQVPLYCSTKSGVWGVKFV